MQNQRQVVDYALRRRALLAEFRTGRVSTMDVCDATPQLLQAAKFHGTPDTSPCPVCGKHALSQVSWVYGDELKHVAGSARKPEELERMASRFAEFTVYVVEVCRACAWNHLVLSYVLGTAGSPETAPRTTRTTRRTAGQ
ncbi:DUF5318 family protein [Prauserella rugosa]|uniref:DUF5318 domain-containing protein n=1 Tax=Prauserella rugosa TaxID=43354 RepID=A0A660CGT7_9PSEU|nr:DUF5318 family protein [Prauserella rugosa]KID28605.1 hypothetical protein HQ32_04180 [Prauserella sp. Am3]KMS91465.1 hypothetical protein ACZ91_09545 [Streptomyces regensis]TWH21634.1 hypothetical protein JD82_03500 [Prauserella rugosa]